LRSGGREALSLGHRFRTPARTALPCHWLAGGGAMFSTPLAPLGSDDPRTPPADGLRLTMLHTSRKNVILRADGSEVRPVSIYFPLPLAIRMRVRCAELDTPMSDFILAAVETALAKGSAR
jgi:hypothetical protein